ncbi:DUF1837 domain-containing protein [Pseudomonas sp. JV414]|uniref:HamA C-terminal domain-containing protein n=1 Tax=Pseudomonas sp. JV414 TaxID=1733110 RepID=UPI0028E15734|nr:DUF1837 domain-containing protein [Pseudomonas sp. JV414]MDT9677717.1 DUF1837 domain-containing protein [Pseudomonas sp. JV414]
MKKIYKRFTRLACRFDDAEDSTGFDKHPFHLDYENGVYREAELVKLIRGALPHFALTPDEYERLKKDDDIDEMYRTAFKRISEAKKNKKGDYGELLLFLILKSFYKNERFVTKVKLRSSTKEQIKGFDCAHFVAADDGSIEIWLGEVKFYKSFSGAVSDVLDEIQMHIDGAYLKAEFSILAPNIEYNKDVVVPDQLVEFLDGSISLDKAKIVIPALVTYDCIDIVKHKQCGDEFALAFKKHFEDRFKTINKRALDVPDNIKIFFILLPLQDVTKIKDSLEKMEELYR